MIQSVLIIEVLALDIKQQIAALLEKTTTAKKYLKLKKKCVGFLVFSVFKIAPQTKLYLTSKLTSYYA